MQKAIEGESSHAGALKGDLCLEGRETDADKKKWRNTGTIKRRTREIIMQKNVGEVDDYYTETLQNYLERKTFNNQLIPLASRSSNTSFATFRPLIALGKPMYTNC